MSELREVAEHIVESDNWPDANPWAMSEKGLAYVSPHIGEIEKVPFPHTLCITLPVADAPTCPHCGRQWGFNMTTLVKCLQKKCPHCNHKF